MIIECGSESVYEDLNKRLSGYCGTDNYYEYLCNTLITDGSKALAETGECYWLLDAVASYQTERTKKSYPFQVWKLRKVTDTSAVLIGEDGNDTVLFTQPILYTDIPGNATLYCSPYQDGRMIIFLPSEY